MRDQARTHSFEEKIDPSAFQGQHPGMRQHPGMQRQHPGMQGQHPGMRSPRGIPGEFGDMDQMGKESMTNDQVNPQTVQKPEDFFTYLEIGFLTFIGLFVINVYFGKSKNYKYAKEWYYANKEYLFKNHSHIGVILDKRQEAIALMKFSYSNYKVYCSGRVNIKYLVCSVEVLLCLNSLNQDTIFLGQ
jgi:Protein of unknown function (DUF1682)